jgi:hypothetical protein
MQFQNMDDGCRNVKNDVRCPLWVLSRAGRREGRWTWAAMAGCWQAQSLDRP